MTVTTECRIVMRASYHCCLGRKDTEKSLINSAHESSPVSFLTWQWSNNFQTGFPAILSLGGLFSYEDFSFRKTDFCQQPPAYLKKKDLKLKNQKAKKPKNPSKLKFILLLCFPFPQWPLCSQQTCVCLWDAVFPKRKKKEKEVE